MKGLLIKDWKTLLKQMKVMLVIVVVLACIPGTYMAAFALFYAAMLPITALAYDERAKWDELAAMMPDRTGGMPSYAIEEEGPDHAKRFTATVSVAGTAYGGDHAG